ncbi:MAG: VanZ family protein [Chloroflexota bacterium]
MPDASPRSCRVRAWLPVIIWATVIFLFSSDLFSDTHTAGVIAPWLHWTFPAWSANDIEGVHLLIRKLGHLSEYFIFALLLMRALQLQVKTLLDARHLFLAVALSALYASSDELHQVFVPSRTPAIFDVLIDACGALGGALCFYLYRRRKPPRGAA